MKRIIAGTLVALPLAIASIPTQASALEVLVNPHVRRSPVREVVVGRAERRRWIRGHWERRHNRRVWVPGHYERY
ncbi:MAG: YXWGXW repeat-containing protein [Iphinoe sp. HA4291-MV1]|nr:YXWGXW repeat-containing protein [Iphinoe sp. HA4291-MV1]